MVKRLRLRPLTAATRVRIPIESPHRKKAGLCTCLFSYSEKGEVTKMVKHIILWKLKEMSETEKAERVQIIKEGLEGLSGKIHDMTDIHWPPPRQMPCWIPPLSRQKRLKYTAVILTTWPLQILLSDHILKSDPASITKSDTESKRMF